MIHAACLSYPGVARVLCHVKHSVTLARPAGRFRALFPGSGVLVVNRTRRDFSYQGEPFSVIIIQ